MIPQDIREVLTQLRQKQISFTGLGYHIQPQLANFAVGLLQFPTAIFEGVLNSPLDNVTPTIAFMGFTRSFTLPGLSGTVVTDNPPMSPPIPYPGARVQTSGTTMSITFIEHQPVFKKGGTNPFALIDKSIREIFEIWISEAIGYDIRRFAPGGRFHVDVAGKMFVVVLNHDMTPNYVARFNHIFPSTLSDQTFNLNTPPNAVMTYTVTFNYILPDILYSPEIGGELPPYDTLFSQELERIFNS